MKRSSSYSGGSEHRAPALLIEIQACGDERKKGRWGNWGCFSKVGTYKLRSERKEKKDEGF